jgi:peptidoglycan-associated lipoprotein
MKTYIAASAAIIAAITGCASTPPAEQASAGPGAAAASSPSATAPRSPGTPAPAASAKSVAGSNAASAPAQRSVYFDYDSNVVKDEFAPVVQSNARYLGQQRGARVKIEGNTDERGSREYNLALGQRRAEAVKERMTLLGVPAQQIETVSFGEEKPRADADNDQAYAENRRADIVYGK